MRFAFLGACLLSFASAGAGVVAGDERPLSSVSGTVMAQNGARLSGALLTLKPDDGGAPLRAVSGAMGAFHIGGLKPGQYDLVVELAGFSASRVVVRLQPAEHRRIDLRLEVGGVRESIDVISNERVERVEAQTLRESNAREVVEALDEIPGISKARRGPLGSDVVMRGFRGADVAVMVDGQRICGACPNRMDPPTFHVDFGEVERVEVARGPFDLKNLGGLGGAVNVVTRRPAAGWQCQPSFSLGSAGYWNPTIPVSWGGRRLSALAGVSYRESQAYRDGSNRRLTEMANYRPDAVERDAFHLGTAWARVLRHHDRGLVQAAYTRQEANDVLYPGLMMDAAYDDTDRAQFAMETIHTKA
jgi:outer membrane receptor protein involved in Fe transport